MSTLVNEAVEAGLYNKFTRYGKMTMHFYHNGELFFKSAVTGSFLNKEAM
jgi:hypothetical protein